MIALVVKTNLPYKSSQIVFQKFYVINVDENFKSINGHKRFRIKIEEIVFIIPKNPQ